MGRPRLQHVRAGDTDPLEITVGATGLGNLAALVSAEFFARLKDAETNHVDGAPLAVKDSANRVLEFDPVGAAVGSGDAFGVGAHGTYECYVLLTWPEGRETRHPAGPDFLELVVTEAFE